MVIFTNFGKLTETCQKYMSIIRTVTKTQATPQILS